VVERESSKIYFSIFKIVSLYDVFLQRHKSRKTINDILWVVIPGLGNRLGWRLLPEGIEYGGFGQPFCHPRTIDLMILFVS
jgi:hypothetical protein